MNQILEENAWYRGIEQEGKLVVSRAVNEIDRSYGVNATGAVSPFYYHNGLHTRMACEDLYLLRDSLGFTQAEFTLAEVAMAAHDIVKTFDRPAGVDETESADWLESELLSIPNISRVAVETGKLAVIGTIPRFSGGTIVQKAVEQVYPTKRAELIAHAVAAADVGRLFTPEGPLLAHLLYKEMQAASGKDKESVRQMLPFQDSQIEFLANYRYPNRDIENILATHKAPVIRYLGKLSRMLEQGSIASWKELMQMDQEFMTSNTTK